jgi:hypothetical protein
MANVTGQNVSPYLSSALSRIQANELAGAPNAKASTQSPSGNAAQTGSDARILSDQTLGALVAMQAESNSGS